MLYFIAQELITDSMLMDELQDVTDMQWNSDGDLEGAGLVPSARCAFQSVIVLFCNGLSIQQNPLA